MRALSLVLGLALCIPAFAANGNMDRSVSSGKMGRSVDVAMTTDAKTIVAAYVLGADRLVGPSL